MARIDIGTIIRGDELGGNTCPHCGDSLNFEVDKEDSKGKSFPTLTADHCGTTYSVSVRELFIDVARPRAEDIAILSEELEEGEAFTQKFRKKGVEDVMKAAQKARVKKSGGEEREPERSAETVFEMAEMQQEKAKNQDSQVKKVEEGQKKAGEEGQKKSQEMKENKPQTDQQKTEEKSSEKIRNIKVNEHKFGV